MNGAQLLRFAAVVMVLAGYVFVFRTGEARVGERIEANARIAERARAGERMLASRARTEAEGRRVRDQLRAVALDGDRSTVVAHFLRDAARIAVVHRATITAITNVSPAGAPAAPQARATLDAVPLDVTVEGRYADVLATMRALSRSTVPAAVELASLARKHVDGPDPTLSAALHVALQRFERPNATANDATAASDGAGPSDVRTRPR